MFTGNDMIYVVWQHVVALVETTVFTLAARATSYTSSRGVVHRREPRRGREARALARSRFKKFPTRV